MIETRVQLLPWEGSGGCLQVLARWSSGAKVARARFRLRCGTWEPLAPRWLAACWRRSVWGRTPSGWNR